MLACETRIDLFSKKRSKVSEVSIGKLTTLLAYTRLHLL